jgi:hypothetical protein
MMKMNMKVSTYFVLALVLSAALVEGCKKNAPRSAALNPVYTAAQVTKGAKLVDEWKCNYCHTPELKGPGGKPIPNPDKLLSGHPQDEKIPGIADMVIASPEYMEFLDNLPNTVWASNDTLVFASNLTPDDATGIGTWSAGQFVATLRSGKHMGLGRRVLYPMPWQELATLPDSDLTSIYAYLRTIKRVKNKVPPPIVLMK